MSMRLYKRTRARGLASVQDVAGSLLSALGIAACCGACDAALCGDEVARDAAAIVRGLPTGEMLPSLVAIVMREHHADYDALSVVCSGSLIRPDVVLTAAHCVSLYGPDSAPEGAMRSWFVSFEAELTGIGEASLDLPADAVSVRRTRRHPLFSVSENRRSGLGPSHDLALVFLDEPVEGRHAGVFLAGGEEPTLVVGSEVLIAGYGLRNAAGYAEASDDASGFRAYGSARVLEVGSHEFRVGRPLWPETELERSLADKCSGDSGGPTFLRAGEGLAVVGVSSRSYEPSERCDTAGVDVRVDVFRPWLEDLLAAEGARPGSPCAD